MPDPSRSKPRRLSRRGHALFAGAAIAALPLGWGLAPAVAGIVETAGVAATLASATTARLGDRMERLRDPDRVETSGVDLTLRLGEVETDAPIDPWLGDDPAPTLPQSYLRDTFRAREAPALALEMRRPARSSGALDLWWMGSVDLGRRGDGMIDPRRSLAGLSTGLDLQPAKDRSFGVSLGFDQGRLDGEDATVAVASLSAYGSFHPTPRTFVDTIAGAALVKTPDMATSIAEDAFASTPLGFGALTFGYEHREGRWLLSPYGRVEASAIDPWTATASARRSSAVMGLRAEYTLRTAGILVRPSLRFELLRDLARVAGTGSGDVPALSSARRFALTPGVRAQITPDWSARLEHKAVVGSSAPIRSVELKIDGRF